MDLHVSLIKPQNGRLPDGMDGWLFDGSTPDRIRTFSKAIAGARERGDETRVKELLDEMQMLPFNRLWNIAFEIEKSDGNTVQDAEHFEGGKGLLISDPEWDGSDAMPLQFGSDVTVHIYGNKPQVLFDYAKAALSDISLNVAFEQTPEINLRLTDHYEIAEATDGAILSKDMPNAELRNTEALRSQIMNVLSEKIADMAEENPHLGFIKLNIYAMGPKTATVEAFNSIQLLADTLQEAETGFQAQRIS